VQRPIPLWFGGHAEPALERAARLGDGWMPNYRTPTDAQPAVDKLKGFLEKAGRSHSHFGIEARLSYGEGRLEVWQALIRGWEAAGTTHLSLNTMGHGFESPASHMDALRTFANAIGLGGG
jgi:alkanesulfonate monooxygenase SsuD/methylene tetrahydromethanopterin reductase-like flavin-dependent oxidoreductase (luciferase family)